MLGEQLAEYHGKVTNQKVLPPDGPHPKRKITFEVNGAIWGAESTMIGNYWSTARPDGTLYGKNIRWES